jgi:CRP-like cAMP-binding protein
VKYTLGSELMSDESHLLQNVPMWNLQLVHTYAGGECFGELALQNNVPRAARIVTATPCHFATVSRDDYTKVLSHFNELIM